MMKRRIAAAMAVVALLMGGIGTTAFADEGGGPATNLWCPGHQHTPPPGGGWGN